MLWDPAAEAKITGFLETLRTAGLRFEYIVRYAPEAPPQPGQANESEALPPLAGASTNAAIAEPALDAHSLSTASPEPSPTSPGSDAPLTRVNWSEPPSEDLTLAAASAPATAPQLHIDFTGPDAPLMIERGGELLHAMESLAASILRLEPEQNDLLSFDALGFKQERQAATERTAQQGIDAVRATGKPFIFPPMNSRERRMLHLVLAASGLPTASSGDGPRRFVVVYPIGATPTPERFDPPPPTRRPGSASGPRSVGGRGAFTGRASSAGRGSSAGPRSFSGAASSTRRHQPSSSSAARQPAAPAAPRLDPNGNPLEQPTLPDVGAATSEEERLASLRRAFRKR